MAVLRGAVGSLFGCAAPEVLVEGRAGTGKSIGILTKLHDACRRWPGVRVLVCRQHRATCTESVMVTWEEKVLGPTHPMVVNGPQRLNRHSHDYPNGSTVVWGGLDQPGKTFSQEWDFVYVNEATEISLEAWELFGRAMRNNRAPYQQMIADCNPGAPAHWLNRRAFACTDALRAVREPADYRRLQRYNDAPQAAATMRRLVSVHQDNPAYFDLAAWRWLPAGETYLAKLAAMSGHRRQRMLEGRWVASEGTVYPEFDEAKHVCPPFAIPADWPVYVGWDPGYDHPTAILWVARAPNGNLYVIDEIYQGGRSVADHCADVRARNAGRTVLRYFGDPQHCFSQTAQAPDSIAIQAMKAGISLTPWPRSTDVEAMVNGVRELLKGVRLRVFATCTHTIDEFQSWRYKRTGKGELPKGDDQFEDADNHAMDVVKGLVAARVNVAPGQVKVTGGE